MDKTALNNELANLLADFDDGGSLTIGADTDVTHNRITYSERQTQYLRNRYGDDYTLTIAVQLSALTARPTKGDLITLDSTQHRLLNIADTPDKNAIHLHLGQKHTRRRQ